MIVELLLYLALFVKLVRQLKTTYLLLLFLTCLFTQAFSQSDYELQMQQKYHSMQASGHSFDSTKNAWWYGGQGIEMYENRDFSNAILNLSYAIRIDSNISEFYYYRGNAYALNRKPAKALIDFRKALELNPDYLTSLNKLGWEYLKNGEFRGALQYYYNYIKEVPRNPRLFFQFNLNEEYVFLLNTLGWQSIRNNDLPKAIRYFENFLNIAQNDPDARLGLALIYFTYGDFDLAAEYLYAAKELKPTLYQGYQGLLAMEKSGFAYSDDEKEQFKHMFEIINDPHRDLRNMTTTSAGRFLMSFIYLVLGIIALTIFILRIKRFESYILYLGVLNLSFGLRFLSDNPLVKITEFPTPHFWEFSTPLISLLIPIAFILFVKYFIGWGWRYSILWLLILSILQGVIKTLVQYFDPGLDLYSTSDTIFGLLATVVLFFHMFLPDMRKNREVQIISIGLSFYLLANFYNNISQIQWIPAQASFDETAYLFFNVCLVYVAVRRISRTEKEFFSVKQDLETAQKIQDGLLPDVNPKCKSYEIASAYLPMVLIGGDFYGYQMKEDEHIGVLVADVSGHGISAALIASMLKVAYTSQAHNAEKPASLLEQMNQSLSNQLNNEFITAAYYHFNFKNHLLTYASAGHPPLIVYNRNTDEVREIMLKGIPIGVFEETKFKKTELAVKKGDRLILYTDGIWDVINNSGENFGKQRLINLIRESKNLLAEDACSFIIQGIQAWAGKKEGETYEDDITLVILDVMH